MSEVLTQVVNGQWQSEERLPAIEYSRTVMEEIRRAVVEGFNKISRGGIEVGGVLFGEVEDSVTRILAWRPVACEHALGPGFKLSAKDEAGLVSILDTAGDDPALAQLQAVGWFRSRTRSEIALANDDVQIFDTYFQGPGRVALVLKPYRLLPTRARFFVRDTGGEVRDGVDSEFALEPSRIPRQAAALAGPAAQPPVPPDTELRPGSTVLSSPEAPEAAIVRSPDIQVELPSFLRVEERPKRKHWRWLLPLVACGLLAANVVRFAPHLVPEQEHGLSLRVIDTAGQLQVTWDHLAPLLAEAEGGTLDVGESQPPSETVVELDRDQLRKGSVTYARHSDDVRIRLTIFRVGRPPAHEYARFVGPAKPNPVEAASRPNEDLAAQVRKLRQQLKDEQVRNRRLEGAVRALENRVRP